jgi:ubiquinol-cytochrome c reductase cytochrome b subunit
VIIRRLVGWVDARTGSARVLRSALDKVFPNHFSFLLGEVALYSFVILVLTGTYLALFFVASTEAVTYDGSYEQLQGIEVSRAFDSALDLSFEVRAGLVMRQAHHWAALIFVGAITAHLARIFFTGAFRRPREPNWIIGLTLLLLAIVNGFAGYSLLDDQLSGSGLRIAYSVAISVPVVGTWMASLLFGGNFPGDDIINRLFTIHVFIVPALIAALLVVHLGLLVRHKHTHFAGHGATDRNVVGERLWPTYVAKASSVFFLTAAVIMGLGGLVQINPIWIYGPFRVENISSASQPDWYMGWLEGALRLMPPWELRAFGYEIPNPFYPGVLLPGITFGLLYLWPFIEARFTGDRREHHVLDRPRDRPVRTALGVATLLFYTVLGLAGADDVLTTSLGLDVNHVVWVLRVALVVVPVIGALVTHRLCLELQRRDAPPEDPTEAARDPEPEGELERVGS